MKFAVFVVQGIERVSPKDQMPVRVWPRTYSYSEEDDENFASSMIKIIGEYF